MSVSNDTLCVPIPLSSDNSGDTNILRDDHGGSTGSHWQRTSQTASFQHTHSYFIVPVPPPNSPGVHINTLSFFLFVFLGTNFSIAKVETGIKRIITSERPSFLHKVSRRLHVSSVN